MTITNKNTAMAVLLAVWPVWVSHTALAASVGVHQLHYLEYDEKIAVIDRVVDATLLPSDDDEVSLHAGVDGVSGATRAWKARSRLERPAELAAINRQADSNVYGQDISGYQIKPVPISEEHRYSVGASWLHRTQTRHEITLGSDYSREPDYVSRALSGGLLWYVSDRKNTALDIAGDVHYDSVQVFDPYFQKSWRSKWSWNGQLAVRQVLSARSVLNVGVLGFRDSGYLSNHYGTILRRYDGNRDGVLETYLSAEHRPEKRLGGGVSGLWMVHWRHALATHLGYRGYWDNWNVRSHTLDAKVFWDVIPSLTLGAGARYYQQSAAQFYRRRTFGIKGFGSSDHRLGAFDATTTSVNGAYRLAPQWTLDGELGFLSQSSGLDSLFWSVGIRWRND